MLWPVELNVKAPDFTLNDFNGKSVSFPTIKRKRMSWWFSTADSFDLSAARTWRSCAKIIKSL